MQLKRVNQEDKEMGKAIVGRKRRLAPRPEETEQLLHNSIHTCTVYMFDRATKLIDRGLVRLPGAKRFTELSANRTFVYVPNTYVVSQILLSMPSKSKTFSEN